MRRDNLTFGLAQIPVHRGNIAKNLIEHTEIITLASECNVDVLVFPELSLTGYELELLESLSLKSNNQVFKSLLKSAVDNNIIIIAGVPLKNPNGKPFIGSVISFPDGHNEFYRKQYLHSGEGEYCDSGKGNYTFEVNESKISLAICADFTNTSHYNDAKKDLADYYLVSALIPKNWYQEASLLLSEIATKNKIPVLLANHNFPTGGWESAGKSGVWDSTGNLVVSADNTKTGLVIVKVMGNDIEGCFNTLPINETS